MVGKTNLGALIVAIACFVVVLFFWRTGEIIIGVLLSAVVFVSLKIIYDEPSLREIKADLEENKASLEEIKTKLGIEKKK